MATYGITDRCTGGVATASHTLTTYVPANAFDDNTGTVWIPAQTTTAGMWIKYAFAAGVFLKISKITIKNYEINRAINAFTVKGSVDDATELTLYSGNCANNTSVQTFTFTNRNNYRYIKIIIDSKYGTDYVAIVEIEMFEGIYPGGFSGGQPYIF